MISVSED